MNLYQQRFLSDKERFEQKFEPIPWSGCWIWMARTDHRPHVLEYGQYWLDDRNVPAHRAAWIIYRGPVPSGMFVCHSCDVPFCVNPNHLFLGWPVDNTADMIRKNRKAIRRGQENNQCKLTEAQAREIFHANGGQYEIARQFGISQSAVSLIKRKKNWRHIHV